VARPDPVVTSLEVGSSSLEAAVRDPQLRLQVELLGRAVRSAVAESLALVVGPSALS
jgi:hypothetical protein